jgi:hypothetical protein
MWSTPAARSPCEISPRSTSPNAVLAQLTLCGNGLRLLLRGARRLLGTGLDFIE